MSRVEHGPESNLNLILAVKQNVRAEIAAVDLKITKGEKAVAELREERTMLIHLAGATGVSLADDLQKPADSVPAGEPKGEGV